MRRAEVSTDYAVLVFSYACSMALWMAGPRLKSLHKY